MKLRFLGNFALGCFVGAFFALALAWIIDESVHDAYQKNWVYLFSALTTLAAASLALSGTFSVIFNQNELARKETERSMLAARALLPPVLSSLHTKAELGFLAAANQKEYKSNPDKARQLLDKLSLSSEELKVLSDCIKFSEDDTARWLSLIISHFQIERSRLDSAFSTKGLLTLDLQITDGALDWLVTLALVSHLFEFARTGRKPSSELSKNELHFPLSADIPGFVHDNWDEVRDQLFEYFEGTGGWSSIAFQNRLLNPTTAL